MNEFDQNIMLIQLKDKKQFGTLWFKRWHLNALRFKPLARTLILCGIVLLTF